MEREVKKYTLEQFRKKEIAINTRTQEEYDKLMVLLEKEDFLWMCEEEATTHPYAWKCYGSDSCVYYGSSGLSDVIEVIGSKYLRGETVIIPDQLEGLESKQKTTTLRQHIEKAESFEWKGHKVHSSIMSLLEDARDYFDNEKKD